MNKGKIVKKIMLTLSLLSIVMSLSSCALIESFLDEVFNQIVGNLNDTVVGDFSDYNETSTPKEEIPNIPSDGKAGYNISILEQKEQEGYEILPSTGTQKVLVIPVYFKDYTPESCLDSKDDALKDIENAFFGEDSSSENQELKTGWESVKSYYHKSSFGKLNIEGMVTSWCPLTKTLKEVATSTSYNDPTIWVLREAINWVKTNYPGIANEYDQDKDGFIDSVALVYPNEYYDSASTQSYDLKYDSETIEDIEYMLWAYTYWDYEMDPNKSSPVANNYLWISYDFFWDGGYKDKSFSFSNGFKEKKLVDCHTLIHEFGHVLGLDDYYSYDYGDDEPTGRLDMMDMNIGDHNSYSKYLLNWIEPSLITQPGEYTITSLTKDGVNALLIPADLEKFSYSPFSEYLIIEFYTPEVLNYLDSKERYLGMNSSVPYLFTKSGIKIYHVDSRLVVANALTKDYYYTSVNNDVINSRSEMQFIGANNTSSRSVNSDFKLINLLSSERGRNAFDSNYYATNRDLFLENDMITEFKFNSGTDLPFNIVVQDIIGNEQATISITYR